MEQFLIVKSPAGKTIQISAIDTTVGFNHKDLGLLLDHLEIIGTVELYPVTSCGN